MAKELVWAVQVCDEMHQIKFAKNKVTIDNGDPLNLKSFQFAKVDGGKEYYIPFGNEAVVLYISAQPPILSYRGIDCATGEPYVPMKAPAWSYVFWGLFLLDFLLLVGGALGGAINLGAAVIVNSIAANRKKSVGSRVAICLAIWFGITLAEVAIALLLGTSFILLFNQQRY